LGSGKDFEDVELIMIGFELEFEVVALVVALELYGVAG